MKHKHNWLTWLLSLIVVATYILPGNFSLVYATDTKEFDYVSVSIQSISQVESNIQPGDTFSLKVDVKVCKIPAGASGDAYISKPSVSGEGIDASKIGISVSEDEKIGKAEETKTIKISGLKYLGDAKDIQVTIQAGNSYSATTVYGEDTASYTLSAKTSSDFADTLVVEKQENLIVTPGSTQNVNVKVTNKGSFTVNQTEAKLSLNNTVEGLKIKTATNTVKNIKSKETKTVSFSIAVDEETKSGVYPATVSILGNSYPVNIQVDSNVAPSALEVSTSGNTVFTPGVAKKATFKLTNVGDRDAKNVRVEVVNSENISIASGGNVKHIGTLARKASKEVELSLKVPASVKTSTVPVQLKLTYLSSTGEEKEDSQYVYLDTTASAASSEVIISNVISPTATYGVDQNFNVKFNLSSKSGAEKLKITVTGDEGIVPKSQNLFFLNKLGKGETKQYTVTLAATSAAVSSSHPIKIEVEYGDGETPVVVNQYGSVNITNPKKDKEDSKDDEEEDKKGKPKVIIGEYSVNPVVVKAGENFELEIGFLNTHKVEAVHNLKANLKIVEQGENNTGTVFAPVKASNTFYISDLNPGEMQTKKITMYTIPSAAPKTYEVSLEMAYEDDKGNEVTATENIGIPVEQATKIEIGDINVDIGQVGMETYLSALIYNTGKTNVTNMVVHIEGEGFSVQDNKVFIGGFESQAQETYEPVLIPEEEGVLTGRLIIDYEDTTGEAKQVVEEFSFQVDPAMDMMEEMPMDEEMMMEEAPQKPKWPYIAAIGSIVIVIIIVVIIVLKKRKKKKEEMMLDED